MSSEWFLGFSLALWSAQGRGRSFAMSVDVCSWSMVAGFWFLFRLLHLSAKEGGRRASDGTAAKGGARRSDRVRGGRAE